MRVYVSFEGDRKAFNVSGDETVGAVKQIIKDYFHVQVSHDEQLHQHLVLIYDGAALQDHWALCDVGISPGTVIQCVIENEQKPVLHVCNVVTGELLPIMGPVFLHSMSVANLTAMVSLKCGFPVSIFRLSTPDGVTLYDRNLLHHYAIPIGTTLRLDTWDGWVELIRGCLLGHRLTVQSHLSEETPVRRFQLQVALYIAASQGHLDLAGWLMDRGIQAEEPVGVHPHRQWCHQDAHRDVSKCPVHAAAERGQLLVLKLFVSNNVLSLTCRDPDGRDPLHIAIKHGHPECVRYLATKLWSVVARQNILVPMHIYIQLIHWLRLGKKRIASRRFEGTTMVKTLLVDGFTLPKMSSKPRRGEAEVRGEVKALLHMSPSRSSSQVSKHQSSEWKSQVTPLKLTRPHSPSAGGSEKAQHKCIRKVEESCLSHGFKVHECRQWKSKVPLPPITRATNASPLFVYSPTNCSYIPSTSLEYLCQLNVFRQNAINCLDMASTFTRKSWMQQLSIARALVRRSVQNMAYKPPEAKTHVPPSVKLFRAYQLVLQNASLAVRLHRVPVQAKNWTTTLLKEVCVYLLLGNVIQLWIQPAFGAHPQFDQTSEVNFYGATMWTTAVNAGLPYGMFYCMNSVECLFEVCLNS